MSGRGVSTLLEIQLIVLLLVRRGEIAKMLQPFLRFYKLDYRTYELVSDILTVSTLLEILPPCC